MSTRIHSLDLDLQHALDTVLRDSGLTIAQWRALDAIREAPGASGAELARACGVTAQSMHTTLVGLEQAGLVVRQPHAVHGRVVQVYLSNAGERRLENGRSIIDGVETLVLAGLTPDERDLLEGLLVRVAGGLKRPRRRRSG
jgi:DNA-binding MarR family transcriptional regulator